MRSRKSIIHFTRTFLAFWMVFFVIASLLYLPQSPLSNIKPALAALSYVGGTSCSGTGATYSCTLNSGLTGGSGSAAAAGDLVIVVTGWASTADGNPGVTTTGYTEVYDLYGNDTRDANMSVNWKIMGGTPDTSVTVSGFNNAANGGATVVHVWRGANQTTPMDVTPPTGVTSTNSALADSPAITPITSGAIVLAVGYGTGDATPTAMTGPSGMSNFVTVNGVGSTMSAIAGIASFAWSSGAYDPAAWTGGESTTSDSRAAGTLAIRPAITTLGDGTDGGNSTIGPGGAATEIDRFSLITTGYTNETVTGMTVTLGPTDAFNNIATVDVQTTGGVSRCSLTPTSNTVLLTSCAIAVTSTSTEYKILITPKTHALMPGVPGASYATTATVTAITATYNTAGTDTDSATITVDNLSPGNVTSTSGTAGNAQVTLDYTNPADTDLNSVVVLRNTVAVTDVPVEGTTYTGGETITPGSSIVATGCVDTTVTPSAADSCIATGLTNGTAYHFKIFTRDSRGNYDAGVVPTGSPFTPVAGATLTISVSAGSKLANVDSGATSAFVHDTACTTDGTCAAFKLAATGGPVSVTSIKITETGTVTANTELANPTIIYDDDANYSNGLGTGGTFGTIAAWAADQTATITNAGLSIPSGSTYYFYIRTDFLNGTARPDGGLNIDYQIAASTDVLSNAGTTSCSVSCPLDLVDTGGVNPVFRPNVTSFSNSTEGALTDGARTTQTISIAGHGFGTTCSIAGGNKVSIGTYDVSCTGATFTDTSITISVDSGVNVYGGTGASGLLVTIGSTADDARLTFYVYPAITSLSPTAATGAKEGDNVIITGTKFRAAQGTGGVQFTNCGTTAGTIVGWGDTSITVTVPAGVLDNDDSCDILLTRDTDAKTVTSTGYVILPNITGITSLGSNAAREYNAADSDGVITLNGNHFGASGTVTIFTVTATQVTTGTCTGTAYQATCVGLQVPNVADATYTGDIVLTRTADSKTNTFAGFRVLPRILSTSPVNLKAGRGDSITVNGDHLCQSGTCPSNVGAADKVTFGLPVDAASSGVWTHISIPSVVVPSTAIDGNLFITSNTSFTSNNLTFDIKFAPTTPTNIAPANGATGVSQTPTATANAFSDGTDGDTHAATNWRMSKATGDYSAGQIVWVRTSGAAETSIEANSANSDGGTGFTNTTVTTQLNCGTTYFWQVRYKDNSGVTSQEWSLYSSEFSFTTAACTPTLTIGVTAGSKVATVNSGVTLQYAHDTACTGPASCAAFTLAISTGSETVTAIKITETGTVAANTDLANLALFYDTNGNWADAEVETQYGTTVAAFTTEAANVTGSLPISSGTTYYVYVRYDLAKSGVYPKGGQGVDFQIAANADVGTSGTPVKTGAPATLASAASTCAAATQTCVKPNATGITTTVGGDGGRSGDSITISGFGFGTPIAGASREDCTTATVDIGCVKFIVGGTTNVANANISSWSNTSIVFTVVAGLASNGGVSAVEMRAANQADATPLTFFVYPTISSLTVPTGTANAAREFDAGDSDGVFTANGDHFGAAGTVTILGSTGTQQTTGTCTGTAYQATCVGLQVPTAIADSTYTGDIVLTRTSDSKTHTFAGFRVLPRIITNTPTSGISGDVIQLLGNHFCQSGTCPVSPNRSVAADNVKFGSTQAADSDFVNQTGGAGTCNGAGAGWNHAEVCVQVPAATPAGSQPTLVTSSTSYTSNTKAFTRSSTVPNAPTSLQQYKSDGTTVVAIGATTDANPLKLAGDISAAVSITMILEVEAKPIATAFDGLGLVSSASCTGTSCTNRQASFVPTTGTSYHWRARAKNTTTSETSAWVAFGANPTGDGSTDGSPANADFISDIAGPTISSVCVVSPTASSCDSSSPTDLQAQVRWNTDENASRQIGYGTSCAAGADAAAVFTNMASKEPTTPTSVAASPHSTILNALTPATTYNYKIRAADAAGNVSYFPADTTCSTFATAAAQTRVMKTLDIFIQQSTASASGSTIAGFPKVFDVFVSESKTDRSNITIRSAFVEVYGISKVTSGNISVNVDFQAGLAPSGITTYAVDPGGTSAVFWNVIKEVTNLNWDCVACTDLSNTLDVTVSGTGIVNSIVGARLYFTYNYVPQ